jgi:hypothetical protein
MPSGSASLPETSRKRNGFFTPDSRASRKLDLVMQGAYVVHLGAPQEQSQEELEGRIEEVDTGRSLRFHSGGELIQFLRERLVVARAEPERDK